MILFVMAYLGGVLAILSSCDLSILPFPFAARLTSPAAILSGRQGWLRCLQQDGSTLLTALSSRADTPVPKLCAGSD